MATAKKATLDNQFEKFTSVNPEMLKQSYEKFADGVSAMADFNKTSLEAMVAAAGALTKGMEKLSAEQAGFVKSTYENGVAAAQSAASAKSVQEAVDIQSEFAREAVEQQLGQATKVAELMIETTKDTVAPLTERYSELVEKIQSFRP